MDWSWGPASLLQVHKSPLALSRLEQQGEAAGGETEAGRDTGTRGSALGGVMVKQAQNSAEKGEDIKGMMVVRGQEGLIYPLLFDQIMSYTRLANSDRPIPSRDIFSREGLFSSQPFSILAKWLNGYEAVHNVNIEGNLSQHLDCADI